MKLKYNAPVVLTFSFICALIQIIKTYFLPGFGTFLISPGKIGLENGASPIGIIGHIFGHADWEHLLANFSLILLLGPILEEKYGSLKLLFMIFITALCTGVLNLVLFDTGILGASGIVFMMILLSSITNFRAGEIPITFILILFLYLGKEIVSSFEADQISQFGHVMGGICGAIFGFIINKPKDEKPKSDKPKPIDTPKTEDKPKSKLSLKSLFEGPKTDKMEGY